MALEAQESQEEQSCSQGIWGEDDPDLMRMRREDNTGQDLNEMEKEMSRTGQVRKAKRAYVCAECGDVIPAGKVYVSVKVQAYNKKTRYSKECYGCFK